MRASVHLPDSPSSGYVRIELDGNTVGYLKEGFYDVVCASDDEFHQLMNLPQALEEAHSTASRRVVRLFGEHALGAVHAHLASRS